MHGSGDSAGRKIGFEGPARAFEREGDQLDLSPFHGWIVFLHVVGVLLFVLAHGVSVAVLLRMRTERNPVALRALLDLSRTSLGAAGIGFVLWFVFGIVAGFSGNWWTSGKYWIWASLAIAIVITGLMTPLGRFYFNRVRTALGVDPKTGQLDPAFQVDGAVLEAAIDSGQSTFLAATGIIGLVVLLWLMVAKPF